MANRLDRDEESLVRVLNLRVRLLDETLVSEFHMGQQAAACANGPDISVLPYLSSNMPNSLQSGRRPHKRLLMLFGCPPHHIRGLGYSPGPFCCPEVPCGAGFRPVVLRVGIRHNTPISAFSGRSPSLFSVCAAGRRRTLCRRIKHLRREVQRQLRGPITHRTRPPPRAVPPTQPATDCAGTTADSCVNADRILTRLSVFRRSKSDPPGSCVTRLLSRLPASTFALPCACP